MSLKEEILKSFSTSEESYLENEIGARLLEQNTMLHNELHNLLDIYEMLQDSQEQQKTPALPSLTHNSRDKSLLCAQVLALSTEFKKIGLTKNSSSSSSASSSSTYKPSKHLIKFCIANQTPMIEDSDVNDDNNINTASNIRQTIITKLYSVRNLRPELKHFCGKVHDIPHKLIELIREDIETENEILHVEIKLVNQALADPRSISRGSVENTKNFTVEELKYEIKMLERNLARKNSLVEDQVKHSKLRPSPPKERELNKQKSPIQRKIPLTPTTEE